MLNKFKPKSEFSKNVLTLMTGTTIAQAIPIAISPILTRLYTPEDFGVFSLFLSISLIGGSIINGRYELALMLPKINKDAINVFFLGFYINLFLSLFILVLIFLFYSDIIKFIHQSSISFWIYFIPLEIFLIGLFNLLNYYSTREKNFKDISSSLVLKSFVAVVIQLLGGLLKIGAAGLILGELFSRILSNFKLIKNLFKNKIKLNLIRMLVLAKKYKDFPKYSLIATLANNLAINLVNLFIFSFYNASTLGFYSLVNRVLNIPISLIGKSVSQVFFQQAVSEFQETGKIINSFNSTLKKLFFIGLPIFLFVFFFIENIFGFVFGNQWEIAGKFARILTVLFFFRFITAPMTMVPIILNKNNIDFYFQLLMLFLIILILLITLFMHLSVEKFLYLFSYLYGLYYLIYLLYLKVVLVKK